MYETLHSISSTCTHIQVKVVYSMQIVHVGCDKGWSIVFLLEAFVVHLLNLLKHKNWQLVVHGPFLACCLFSCRPWAKNGIYILHKSDLKAKGEYLMTHENYVKRKLSCSWMFYCHSAAFIFCLLVAFVLKQQSWVVKTACVSFYTLTSDAWSL